MYVLVDQHDNILRGPEYLPETWVDRDGIAHVLRDLTEHDLASIGWIPVTLTETDYDPRFEYLQITTQRIGNRLIINQTAHFRDLILLRRESNKELDMERDRRIDGGITFKGRRFDTDRESRQNITAMATAVTSGAPLPEGFTWRAQDNTNVPMTAADLLAFAAHVMKHVNDTYVASWHAKAELNKLSDPAAIVAFDVTQHWPPLPASSK